LIDLDSITEEKITEIWPKLTERQREALAMELSEPARKEKCGLYDNSASFSKWAMSWFYVPETKSPIFLYPHQRKAIDIATERDANGLFKYSLVHYGDIKKSGKTTIAAMIALRFAFLREWTSIKVVGQKLDQAKSRSYFYICRALDLNPQFAKMQSEGKIIVNNYTIRFTENNSMIQAIPASPSTEAGGNDDLIIWTEIGSAKTEAAQQLWTEMVIPPRKYGYGIKWTEGYAGHIGESPILEEIYNNNVKLEYQISDNPKIYSNARTFVMWNDIPQLKRFQTDEYYKQQSTELLPSEFDRVHRNQWVSSQSSFIPYQWWESCAENLPELTQNEIMILGVDAAISGDSFAVVGVTKHPKDKDRLAVRTLKIWKPKPGQSIIFSHPDPKQNELLPDGYITDLCKRYKVKMIMYDPYQLYNLATQHNLSRKSAFWEAFNQGAPRLEADANLYHLIRENKIAHPNFLELNEQVKNANSQSDGESKMRIVKRSESQKIDSVVALSMASFIAKKLNL